MKVTALISGNLISEVRKYAKGNNLKIWTLDKKLSDVLDRSLRHESDFFTAE